MIEDDTYELPITIFTPTFNRAYILNELYESLLKQTVFAFEWLIVDDGSSDHTDELVTKWLKLDNPFSIRYYKQENGGKHRAINHGVQIAHGELFFIVDSDDRLTEDAIESVITLRNSLPTDVQFAGVAGNRGKNKDYIIGTTFMGDTLDCTSLNRSKYGINGDKAEVFFTEIMRRYPFPEYEGENFVTEALVWDQMAIDGFKLRYFNQVIYLCDYLEDGLTSQGLDLYYRNPLGYGHYLRQSRRVGKFGKCVQNYYDVECYLHWRRKMGLRKVAELIGTKSERLFIATVKYKLHQMASVCKQFVISIIKRR